MCHWTLPLVSSGVSEPVVLTRTTPVSSSKVDSSNECVPSTKTKDPGHRIREGREIGDLRETGVQ